jgi:hypothetical protein
MQLELEGDTEIISEGNIEVHLPDYITMLNTDEMLEIKRAMRTDQMTFFLNKMIFAAGREPSTNDIIMVTFGCKFFRLNTEKWCEQMPIGKAIPIDWGHTISFGPDYIYEIDVEWALERADQVSIECL